MRYSFFSAAVLALSSVVSAQVEGFDSITSPTLDQSVTAGTNLDIIWEPSANYSSSTVTITLLEGATTSTLSLGDVVATGISSSVGKYTWTVPTNLTSFPTYGFKLSLDGDSTGTIFQYSFPFHITGLSSSSTSTSSTGTPTTVTLHLSTGSAYTSSATSISVSSNTSTIACTSTLNSTTTSATFTSTSTSTSTPTSNLTILSTTVTTQASKTSASVSKSATGTAAPTQTSTSAAVANIAKSGFAVLGGLVLAFAL